jgi:2-polyprenyl-3-methyl-5-hydroxy-6-metoxy-1,4-benzoquinol methylase
MYSLSECPICNGRKFIAHIETKDFTVSQETFSLQKCETCSLIFTNPRPEENQLYKYYQSDQYTSHTTDNQSVIDYVYRFCRSFTLRWKHSLIKENVIAKEHLSILDYGCGTGDFLNFCKSKGHTVVGFEPTEKAREIARSKQLNIIRALDDSHFGFDVITLWHVLEHVPDLNETLTLLSNRLNKNGTMFIAVPNPESADAELYQENWAGYDVPRHLWHFSKQAMQLLVKKTGLHFKGVIPMKLDAYYVSLLSEKYKTGKISVGELGRAFYQGVRSNLKATSKKNHSSLIYILRKNESSL